MKILALLLLPALLGLVLIIIVAIWSVNVLSYRLIGRKHEWMEEILATGDAPQSWCEELTINPGRQRQHSTNRAKVERLQKQTQRRYLRKFDQLIHYAQTTTLVADEETRDLLLTQLQAARAAWLARTADALAKNETIEVN